MDFGRACTMPRMRAVMLVVLALGCSANSGGGPFHTEEDAASDAALDATDDLATHDVALDSPAPAFDRVTPTIDVPPVDDSRPDTGAEVMNRYDVVTADGCDVAATCTPRPSGCEAAERCNNGLDDDCDGMTDEGCPCVPGAIQTCFLGPPGARNVGVCRDGIQRCTGTGEFGTLEACVNSVSPSAEVCDRIDNDCDGCVDEGLCCDGPPDGMCRATLSAGVVSPDRGGCFVDEVVSRNNPGTLVYACRGGEATATFGAYRFQGSYMGGQLDVRLTTMFRFSDGCNWVSTQRIYGDPRAPTMRYTYQEAIAPGQRGCAAACSATATITVRP